jgi:hypothetical protein
MLQRMFRVFQMFQRYVSSVFSECMLQLCLSECCICFKHTLHVFYLDVWHMVAMVLSVLWCFFKCFRSMFQVFQLPSDVSLFGTGRALNRRVNLCRVLPNLDGDARRIHGCLSWFGQRRPNVQRGRRVLYIFAPKRLRRGYKL